VWLETRPPFPSATICIVQIKIFYPSCSEEIILVCCFLPDSSLAYCSTLNMEVVFFPEASVNYYMATYRYLIEECTVLEMVYSKRLERTDGHRTRSESRIKPFYLKISKVKLSLCLTTVGIATGYGLDDRGVGVRVPVGSRFFSTSSRPALRPSRPPIQWVLGALSPGIKRKGRGTDHSPTASAEVKKMCIYTTTPPYAFTAQCLIS
jgi:hypothetical protein